MWATPAWQVTAARNRIVMTPLPKRVQNLWNQRRSFLFPSPRGPIISPAHIFENDTATIQPTRAVESDPYNERTAGGVNL